jgi:hypothetical protein
MSFTGEWRQNHSRAVRGRSSPAENSFVPGNPQNALFPRLTLRDAAATIAPMLVYLAGAIEYAPDRGRTWRANLTPFLRELGHRVYDPALDETKNLDEEEVRDFRGWKATDLPRFQQTVRKIIAYDLDCIEQECGLIICYWDEHAARGAGTQGELTIAHRRGIPVYLVLGTAVESVSGWLLGCSERVFPSFTELKNYLAEREPARTLAAGVSTMGVEAER